MAESKAIAIAQYTTKLNFLNMGSLHNARLDFVTNMRTPPVCYYFA